MANVTSNAHELSRELRKLIESFGFDITVEGEDLGRDCAGIVADGIAARSIDERAGSSGEWAPNAPEYAALKERKYGVRNAPNTRTGQMLSVASLLGKVVVTTSEVEIMYGTGQPPSSSATGYMTKQDRETTDIEKAFWATQGGRDFYFLDDNISDAVFERVEGCLDQYLAKEGW